MFFLRLKGYVDPMYIRKIDHASTALLKRGGWFWRADNLASLCSLLMPSKHRHQMRTPQKADRKPLGKNWNVYTVFVFNPDSNPVERTEFISIFQVRK